MSFKNERGTRWQDTEVSAVSQALAMKQKPRKLKVFKQRKLKVFKQSDAKLRELIVYICQKFSDQPGFDLNKLCEILYVIDFTAYAQTGKPITGATYIKAPDGLNHQELAAWLQEPIVQTRPA